MFARSLLLASVLAVSQIALPARADPNRLQRLAIESTLERTTDLSLRPGRVTSIQFEGLRIQAIVQGDRSQVTAFPNAPLDSGFASVAFLQPTQKQIFPGATHARVPNIKVIAVDDRGKTHVFSFNIHFGAEGPDSIAIGPGAAPPATPTQTVATRFGPANVHHLQAGLEAAISRQSLPPTSQTASRIRNFIARLRNGATVVEAMAAEGLAWETVVALAEDGQKQLTRERLEQFVPASEEATDPGSDDTPRSPGDAAADPEADTPPELPPGGDGDGEDLAGISPVGD